MDLSKLTMGSKVVIGGGVLLLIDSFLHWQEVSFGPISTGVSMWHGWGVLIGLLLLAILAWEAVQLVNIRLALGPLSPSMVTAALSVLLVLFTVLKVLTNDFVATWAWIGLVLSAGIVAGAWLNMKTAGESISDLRTSVTAATSSATAAAKAAAAARSDGTSAPAAPSPDPAIETADEPSDTVSGSGDTTD
ncbi:MAG TPA: hypothetical protein VJ986_08085 [Gaiellaceae bacterium]|nr:hypothetical protein [Gaiellaceae bacterium]